MFKVVRLSLNFGLCSACYNHSIGYKEGEWTRPEIGKLFVFERQWQAIEFMYRIDQCQLWEVETEGKPIRPRTLLNMALADTEKLKLFWLTRDITKWHDPIGIEFWNPPAGTLCVDAVKLIRRIR